MFAGEGRRVSVTFRNSGGRAVEMDLRTRIYQASSATAILLGETPWKKLQVLAGQTVLESTLVDLPMVKAGTMFLVQWVEGTNKVIGTTQVMAFPVDLLKELKPLAGEEALGVFDPRNQLKPLLAAVGAEFVDLEDAGLEHFRGKLAIVGPFQSRSQMREGLASQIKALAQKGVAVVWAPPPPEPRETMKIVIEGKGAVVVVESDLVANLSESPLAQLNLIHFCRLALSPEPARLPYLSTQQ